MKSWIKKHPVIVSLALLYIVWRGAHFYMEETWDDHIISSPPKYFSVKEDKSPWRRLTDEEINNLPDIYKKPVEIVQKEDTYILTSHNNQSLRKTGSYIADSDGPDWIHFRTKGDLINIGIIAEGDAPALRGWGVNYGCESEHGDVNAQVKYKLSKNKWLIAAVDIKIFVNFIQYWKCYF